ncbi:class I SAM-dependent methyltransferase, partial [Lujinxingia vulgaris]
ENNPLLRRVYALDGDKEETRRVYAEWAEQYDRDTLDGMGYVAPGLVARDAKVLDAGCGTGLAGVELKKLGFTNIDGNDLSREMLEVAGEKNAYGQLSEADLTVPLEIADDSYDAVISVGVFTSGHVKPKALDELARVTRKGGQIVVTVHEKVWEADGYPDYLEDMEMRGLVNIQAVKEAP